MSTGINKYAPPASIRGTSLAELRAQRKADKEVEELFRAQSPLAAAKAFTLGLTTGTALSYATAAPMLVPEILRTHEGIEQQAHLAHLFGKFGLDEAQSRRAASGLQRYLTIQAPPYHVEEIAKSLVQRSPGAMASDAFLNQREAKNVLNLARESFEAAGKKAPGISEALGTVAKRYAPYAVLAGLAAGLGNVVRTRAKRKELEELRRYAREH